MKIQYKNVCSIRQAEVEFPLGKLVCLKGESNQGKSAAFYGLLAGFTNSPEFKKFINIDALREDPKAFAWIGLFDDEGNQFQVQAGTNYLYYRTNKAKYEKVGRKNIFELMEDQIPGLLYDPEDTRQIMNIQGEDDGFFPIDRSDKQIFKTYERLLSLSNTSEVLQTIKMDIEDLDIKMTDALSTIQQYTEKSSKIDTVLSKCEEFNLEEIINVLEQLDAFYTQVTSDYINIEKTAQYIKSFSCRAFVLSDLFDIAVFQRQLEDTLKVINLTKYIELNKRVFNKEQFDLQKAIMIAQDTSVALEIIKQINETQKSLDIDKEELIEVSNILNSIKTCPLCGKPMGECND